jgi:hypothetical protein
MNFVLQDSLRVRERSSFLVRAALLALLAFAGGCGMCGNEIGYETKSPSGKWRAVAFERDCGATTRSTTEISVLQGSQPLPNEPGNIFSAEDDFPVRMEWKSDQILQTTYPPEHAISSGARFLESRLNSWKAQLDRFPA